jgi:hypothetical protein
LMIYMRDQFMWEESSIWLMFKKFAYSNCRVSDHFWYTEYKIVTFCSKCWNMIRWCMM